MRNRSPKRRKILEISCILSERWKLLWTRATLHPAKNIRSRVFGGRRRRSIFFCSVSFSSFIFCFAYFAPSKPLRSYRPHAPLPFVDELVDEFILFAPKVFAPLAFVVSFGAYFAVGSFYFPLLFLLLVVDVVQVCVAGPLSSLPIRVRACTRDFELGDDGIWSRNTSLFFHRLALLLWRNSCLVSPVPAQHESEKT